MVHTEHGDFASLLKRYRVAANLTQEELAERAQVSARAVSDLERGARRTPYRSTIDHLAEALDLTPDDRSALVAAARRRAPIAPPQPLSNVAMPAGGFLGARPKKPFVGREHELAHLIRAAETVTGGAGRLVMLTGEPGIGKTRLAQEMTIHLRDRAFLIATGRCYEPQQAVPYYPFLDALAYLHAECPPSVRGEIALRWPQLGWIFPTWIGSVSQSALGRSGDQQQLFEAVTGFLGAVAVVMPVAILLDDLHWADQSTLDLLQHLARHTRSRRILLLGTYRDVEVQRTHPLRQALHDLHREQLVERVAVRRMSEEVTGALIAGTLGEQQIAHELAGIVYRQTEGNAFFTVEVLRALIERGDVYQVEGRWRRHSIEKIAVPESVRDAIGERLSRLEEQTQRVLTEASVLGQTFRFDDLEAMSNGTEDMVERALDEATAARLLRESGRDDYEFSHALVQQTLYQELPSRRRLRLHESAARALEARSEREGKQRAAELAWHFLEAHSLDRALHYTLQAGFAAMLLGAYSEGRHHYQTALELVRASSDRVQEPSIMVWLGACLMSEGRLEEALQMLEAGRDLAAAQNDRTTVNRAAAFIGYIFVYRGKLVRARAYFEQAVQELEDVEDSASVCWTLMAMGYVLWCLGEWEQAEQYTYRALDSRQDPEIDTTTSCQVDLARLSIARGEWARARDFLETALTSSHPKPDFGMVLYADWLLAKLDLLEGKPEQARTRLDAIYYDPRMPGDNASEVQPILVEVYLALGELNRAALVAEESLQLARHNGHVLALVGALDVHGRVLAAQRRWDEAEAAFDQAITLARSMPYPYGEAQALYHWSRMDLQDGNTVHARQRLQAAGALFERLGARADALSTQQALADLGAHL